MSKRPEENLWYVHAPTKNERRVVVEAPPPSNIPYLNGVMDTEEELNKKQVMYFRETDSDFVKLSKMGGRENLLRHQTKERPKEPVGYPIPAWWTDMMQHSEPSANDKQKYVFEVPVWFAHQTKISPDQARESHHQMSSPYAVDANARNFNKYEAIEEPKKYGELRNYLNPVKVRQNKSKSEYKPSFHTNETRKNPSATTMPKLIGNFYQKERPDNYEHWKSQNDISSKHSIGVTSSSKLLK